MKRFVDNGSTTIVGGQWGDEGKGKIVDLLAEKAKLVIRYSGGDNAGHTVVNPHGEFKLHLIPSGIFHPGVTCILGNGVAINPIVLLQEVDELSSPQGKVLAFFLGLGEMVFKLLGKMKYLP